MIKLIVLDIDGTMTNGKITYDNNGIESKSFDVKDGMAIASWNKKLKLKSVIITGRKSDIVSKRAKELGITHVYQGFDNKDEILNNILEDEKLSWDEVAGIGDDLNDYKMLKKVGFSCCVNNAVKDIKDLVDFVTTKNGGDGAIREMIELILQKYYNKKLVDLWV